MADIDWRRRPTVREWKAHQRRIRWERRLARAPYYRLALVFALILSAALLIGTVALYAR